MDRSSILAHRGLFFNDYEKNSPLALKRALDEGFGIETDLRFLSNKIIISHDPPVPHQDYPTFSWLIDQVNATKFNNRIALNIKSDGLAKYIDSEISGNSIDPNLYFAFDMTIPDCLSYLDSSIKVYSRISEYEPSPFLIGGIQGVWVDSFNGSFDQVCYCDQLLSKGYRVSFVSPELHGRDHAMVWNSIKKSQIYKHPLFEICTDFPLQAARVFAAD